MEIVGAEAEFAARAAEEWLAGRGGAKSEPAPKARRVEVRSPKGGRRLGCRRGCSRLAGRACRSTNCRWRCSGGAVQVQLVGLGVVPDFELVEQLRIKADRPVGISRAQVSGRGQGGGGRSRAEGVYCRARDRPGRLSYVMRFATAQAGCICKSLSQRSLAPAPRRLSWRAGQGRSSSTGRESGGESIRAEPPGGPAGRVGQECFDADKVGSPVRLRHWRPGDRFQPIGMACPVKLQDFFTNQKVPRARRRRLIVATTADGVVFWVEGLRISERFKLTRQTIRRLQWRWKRL